jgi:hypothetical protein
VGCSNDNSFQVAPRSIIGAKMVSLSEAEEHSVIRFDRDHSFVREGTRLDRTGHPNELAFLEKCVASHISDVG